MEGRNQNVSKKGRGKERTSGIKEYESEENKSEEDKERRTGREEGKEMRRRSQRRSVNK